MMIVDLAGIVHCRVTDKWTVNHSKSSLAPMSASRIVESLCETARGNYGRSAELPFSLTICKMTSARDGTTYSQVTKCFDLGANECVSDFYSLRMTVTCVSSPSKVYDRLIRQAPQIPREPR